jgi:hypothetical protein
MITSDYGRSASDTPHPRTPAAQLQLAGGQRDVVAHRCGPGVGMGSHNVTAQTVRSGTNPDQLR